MKKIAKYLVLALLVFATVLSLAACKKDEDKTDDTGADSTDKVWNINTVYDQAKTLGYEGSLDEFLELVSGKDGKDGKDGLNGVSITNSIVDKNGHLVFILSDGKTLDAGELPSTKAPASGVFKVTFDYGNGETFVTYSENYRVTPPEAPVRENYRFNFWYIKLDSSLQTYFGEMQPWIFDAFAITRDITLYASWTQLITNYQFNVTCADNVDLSGIRVYFYTESGNVAATGVTDSAGTVSFKLDTDFYYISVDNSTLPSGYTISYDNSLYYDAVVNATLTASNSGDDGIDTYAPEVGADGGPPVIGGGTEDEGDWWENIKYDETNLIFMMTKCSNNEELSSGCERYLAGEGEDVGTESIDMLVKNRNDNAYELTNVTVTYKYYDDNAELYGFSKMYDVIEKEVFAADSSTPDMYCNWMTDLLVCSLKGCFGNLYSKQYGAGDYKGNNHFNLANSGYMADLMGSLTLSTQKIYVVASDYFIDLIRSFYVVPVNVTLFNEIAETIYPDEEYPTIDTFFSEIKPCDCTNYDKDTRCTADCADGGWTYDRLIEFSQAIFETNETGTTENINDRLGFALGANGLPAAGLIYSSSVTINNKEWNRDAKKYDYSYPATNQGLYDLFAKISDMMDKSGIYYVTENDANSLSFEGIKTPLLAIRNQFTTDKLLFGGIVLLGSLEYQSYQVMKTSTRGGFGIVPVPVFKAGDDYLTQIHVTGRAGAVRANTQKFVQCSAFLNYQSSNSLEIINDYYEYTLVYGAAAGENGVFGNVEMAKYIRQNVRTSFDKLFEDAIGFMYADVDRDSVNNRYHNLLANNGYQFAGMSQKYEERQPVKAEALKNLEAEYTKLPA